MTDLIDQMEDVAQRVAVVDLKLRLAQRSLESMRGVLKLHGFDPQGVQFPIDELDLMLSEGAAEASETRGMLGGMAKELLKRERDRECCSS